MVLEKEVSQRFDHVDREIRELKGMVASLCNNFSTLSTTFSFEDLLSNPPSPPHHKPAPPTSAIPTSLIFTSPSVPPTSPTPPLALITFPQPVPSLHFPPFCPLSHLSPLPIPLPMPTVSTPSPSSSDADKKGEKDSDV
ncbi:extensin-like [Neltuma alba]|uniref:extensin-like n=1 Tax=Neltuma alba TaxID=207710 RepID=UPI0010A39504|nr:extensin-like [Prosopis alba]